MNRNDQTSFEAHENVACASECTGLMPAMPNDEDVEALEDEARMYAIHAPEEDKATKDNGRKRDGTGKNAAHRRK